MYEQGSNVAPATSAGDRFEEAARKLRRLQTHRRHARPLAIRIACTLGFVGCGMQIVIIAGYAIASPMASWSTLFAAMTALGTLALTFGLWFMKKWAALAYLMVFAAGHVFSLSHGSWDLTGLVVGGVVAAAALKYYPAMH